MGIIGTIIGYFLMFNGGILKMLAYLFFWLPPFFAIAMGMGTAIYEGGRALKDGVRNRANDRKMRG